ncbi:helix-turn-helix domain-containing protein [Pseudobutyrivibrio xylanivorans]|uniref:Helix-turn-helix n=1 Tax=Pseudobutyrivibrio xylanivorans TaxID=185007 RepID=A0A1G5RPR4_PSEXY|nr:helix-turn-helix transcriptional regulator [Pseudobutyrivibrio xylanivorans]SCZ76115.1 Helix-turn-helix [Pseudobutyrivibrio xylanivorans]
MGNKNEHIFQVMKEKGITQKQLSKMTGISESTISDWKTKGKVPGIDKIMLVSKAIGVSPNELLRGESEPLDVNEIIRMLEGLDLKDKKYLLAYLKGVLKDIDR